MPKTRTSGQGRPKGSVNRDNRDIREMIVGALCAVGGTNYLARQAEQNPVAFMSLIGRVLPLQVSGENGGALVVDFRWADAPPTIDANVDTARVVDTDAATDTDDPPAITFISDC